MKIIDSKIANGFRRMKASLGTDAEMSRVLQISRAHVGRILKGKINYLEDDTWERIKHIVEHYTFDDNPNNVSSLGHERIKCFPVISDTVAATCNTVYCPISVWADAHAEDRIVFSEGRTGDFIIRVTDDSMLPWYPQNTLILVRPNEKLKNGDRVIAVLGNGAVAFKVFAEKDDKFFLFSVNAEDGQDLVFRKDDFTSVRAIYLVIQSMRDERALERAMTQKGIRHFWQEKLKALRIADS